MVTAVDRFQTICYPMVHRIWQPKASHRKMALAWAVALAFCAPQAIVFGVNEGGEEEAFGAGRRWCVARSLGTVDGELSDMEDKAVRNGILHL